MIKIGVTRVATDLDWFALTIIRHPTGAKYQFPLFVEPK